MLNIALLPPVKGGKEEFRKVERITINGEVVLTTPQVSEFYGTEDEIVTQNFRRNQKYFVENKHYIKLEGDDLKAFKTTLQSEGQLPVGLRTSSMYLWTRRGVARHAKMLTTEKAWAVFEKMEDTFFRCGAEDFDKLKKELRKEYERIENMWRNLRGERIQLECERENLQKARLDLIEVQDDINIGKAKVLNALANSTTNEELRDELIRQAAKLLTNVDFVK